MSNKKALMRFHFYFVTISDNDDIANFKIDTDQKLKCLLTLLHEKTHLERTWTRNNDLDNRIILQEIAEENEFWRLNFVKVRDGMLPGVLDTEGEFSELTLKEGEYMGEDMTIIYSPNHSVIGVQRNFFSVSASKTADYFNEMQMTLVSDGRSFKFEPITDSVEIPNSAIYRGVEISCYDLSGGSLEETIGLNDSFGAKRATLLLSMGTAPKSKGLKERVVAYVNGISRRGTVTKALINFKVDESSPVESIDLLNHKLEVCIKITYSKTEPITHQKVYSEFLPKFREQLDILTDEG
jgi:hypothetical protein